MPKYTLVFETLDDEPFDAAGPVITDFAATLSGQYPAALVSLHDSEAESTRWFD